MAASPHAARDMIDVIRTFRHVAVRDLAWAIASPHIVAHDGVQWPLFTELSHECAVRNLPLLRRLDIDPTPLHDFLSSRRKMRLGDRFEACVHFALAQCELGTPIIGPLHASQQIVDRVPTQPACDADDEEAEEEERMPPQAALLVDLVSGGGGTDSDLLARRIMRRYTARRFKEQRRLERRLARSRQAVTVGEFDFVFARPAAGDDATALQLQHLEVSVKYLLWSPTLARVRHGDGAHELNCYHGPHRLESLALKIARGKQQMALYAHPRSQEWLRHVHAATADEHSSRRLPPPDADGVVHVTPSYALKGYLFYPLADFRWQRDADLSGSLLPRQHVWSDECIPTVVLPCDMNARHMCGWYTEDVRDIVATRHASRWVILPKPFWLAAVVIPDTAATCSSDAARAHASCDTAAGGSVLTSAATDSITHALSGLQHWSGMDAMGPSHVLSGEELIAAVTALQRVAEEMQTPRALRVLVAELQYVREWPMGAGGHASGAWVEVSRGFVVEAHWATEDDAAHAARYGREMDAYK